MTSYKKIQIFLPLIETFLSIKLLVDSKLHGTISGADSRVKNKKRNFYINKSSRLFERMQNQHGKTCTCQLTSHLKKCFKQFSFSFIAFYILTGPNI